MVGCCCAEACTAAVLCVSRAVLSVVLGAWSVRCVGRVDWVDCRCFLSFVFLGGARRLELSPCNTPMKDMPTASSKATGKVMESLHSHHHDERDGDEQIWAIRTCSSCLVTVLVVSTRSTSSPGFWMVVAAQATREHVRCIIQRFSPACRCVSSLNSSVGLAPLQEDVFRQLPATGSCLLNRGN